MISIPVSNKSQPPFPVFPQLPEIDHFDGPALLRLVGMLTMGPHWHVPMAEQLGVNSSLLYAIAAGKKGVSPTMLAKLRDYMSDASDKAMRDARYRLAAVLKIQLRIDALAASPPEKRSRKPKKVDDS